MGNSVQQQISQEKSIQKNTLTLPQSSPFKHLTQNPTYQLAHAYAINQSFSKVQFHYIHPLRMKTEQNIVAKIRRIEQTPTSQLKLKNQVAFKSVKIAVSWNSFVKIKQKDYLLDYQHIQEIGCGAYGVVSKIKMKYGGFFRAAKIVKNSIMSSKSNQAKLNAEVSIPMKLDHPNLIKLFQVFQCRDAIVIVMELCEGGDLFHRIKKCKNLSEKMVAQIFTQILSAVVYMHKMNIIHRDLKPQNILYDNQSKLYKITDFGIAVQYNINDKFAKKLDNLSGTPYYMAPQVIKRSYDQKCDVWSCGVILYVLLSGFPPFYGKSNGEIFDKITNEQLSFKEPIWAKRSKSSKQFLMKLLEKDPKKRLSAADAMKCEWIQNTPQNQDTEIGAEVIEGLKTFYFKNKLTAVVYTYIASQLYSNKDKENLMRAFKDIDRDGDGVIQKNQLLAAFNNNSSFKMTEEQIEKIIHLIDTNGSGLIDFTEFVVAASKQQELLDRKRLENAFAYLDTDHSGYISFDQVKQFLDGSKQTEEQLRKIFRDADENGDGNISLQQFIELLTNKTKNEN